MRKQYVRFFVVVSIFIFYTFFKVIQLWPSEPIASVLVSILLFVVMLSGMFIYRAHTSVFDKVWFQILSWSGSLIMALWATFIIVSIPFDLMNFLVTVLDQFNFFSGIDPAKITNAIHGTYIVVFVFSVILVALGFLEVIKGPKIKETKVTFKNLPSSFQGLKIAQISDLHVGTTIRSGYVAEVVRRTNAANPDLIFLTGDIVDSLSSSVADHLKPLRNLKSKYGSFYVTGNHEYYWDTKNILEKIKELQMTLLLNENAIIKIDESNLMVAGITDSVGSYMLQDHKPDLAKALSTSEKTQFKILLTHRPSVAKEAEKLGFDLQFSGHTHAGQFFPFNLFIGLAHKYSRGLYKHENMWIYVNPGTGYWGPADRLGVTAEISLITLA